MRTQDHDAVLDGLRGFAAIAVLVFHLGHWFGIPGLAANSGLAVDFFFCLSGYVLAMAYRPRLDAGWGFLRFMQARFVRLMPMIVAGTLVSAAYVAFRIAAKHEAGMHGPLAAAAALGLAGLPYFDAPRAIGGPEVFPLNGPQYSLFLEFVVNAFWASTSLLRGRIAAWIFAVLGIIGVAALGLGGDETATFLNGLPRVFGSFYIGTLAFASGALPRSKAVCILPIGAVLMAGLFLFPSPLPMPVIVLWIATLSPLIVRSAAGVHLPDRLRAPALLLGRLSFPLYALHYPIFCWINGLVQTRTHRQVPALEIPIILVAVPLFAWMLLILYDEPLRRRLARRAKARAAMSRDGVQPAGAVNA